MSELNKVKLEETNRGKHSISDSLHVGYIIVVIINSLDSSASNLLLSCCPMNLASYHNLGHYPSYNVFPTLYNL